MALAPSGESSSHAAFSALGGVDAVYVVDFVRLVHRVDFVPDEAAHLLRWIDGRRTLQLVIASSNLSEKLASELLQGLVGDGVLRFHSTGAPVRVQSRARSVPKPPDSESIGTWGDDLTVLDIPVLE